MLQWVQWDAILENLVTSGNIQSEQLKSSDVFEVPWIQSV